MGACYSDSTGGAPGSLKSHSCVLEGTVGLNRADLHPIVYGPYGPGAVQATPLPAPSLLLPRGTVPWLVLCACQSDCTFFGAWCSYLQGTNCILTEPQHTWDWKGPLEMVWSNPLLKAYPLPDL